MATKEGWRELLSSLTLETDHCLLQPVLEGTIAAFEKRHGLLLPTSYRTYCQVFGAGDLSKQFHIAVPNYKGRARRYDLDYLHETTHDDIEYKDYSPNPEQHERGIFFASDIINSYHFFDPKEVMDSAHNEFAVYTLFRDFEVIRTAESFADFILDVCLGGKRELVMTGDGIHKTFQPAAVYT